MYTHTLDIAIHKYLWSICLFRQNTYLRNKKHTLTCQGGTGYYKAVTTSPVVSWRGWGRETPPPTPRLNCHSLLNHGWVKISLSVVACPSSSATALFTLMVDWCLFDLSIFHPFSLVMSRELRICPGVGGRKCCAFLSSLDRDPHPTCARCRGKICTRDMTCDFCVGCTPGQWELLAKKRTYKERKRSRPSGFVLPAPGATPGAGTSSEVPQPGTSSSFFSRPSGG